MKNVILITSDELRADCLGYAGNSDIKTPHIDALAKQGTVFKNHFCPFPKCVPSRVSMHTGRYTHTDGFRTVMKANHLPKGAPNMGEFLRDQGYETAVLGLNHVWDDDWFYGDHSKGSGAVDYHSFSDGVLQELAKKERHYPEGTPREGPAVDALSEVDFWGLQQGSDATFCDENRAEQAIYYLKEVRDRTKPFFMQLNLSKPHPAYKIHEPFYSMYQPEEIQSFPHDLPQNAPLCLRAQREHRLGNDIPEGSLREIQAVYYGMISFIDSLVGQVMECIDTEGLSEDTLIIFCSDHGDYAGQYGINEKWDGSLQDCLMKVPFIMAGPGIPEGKTVDSLTEHVDIPATVFDYLDLKKPSEWVWHGSSMLPTLRDQSTKSAVFADGGHEQAMRERFNNECWVTKSDGKKVKATGGKQLTYRECPDAMARAKMVRTQDWKLVIRETGDNELYHLANDPWELNNIYGLPEHQGIVNELLVKLVEWCLRTDTDLPYLKTFGA